MITSLEVGATTPNGSKQYIFIGILRPNEPIYKAETDPQTRRTALCLPRGRGLGEGWSGRLGLADVSYHAWRR